jgi:hypothetical protein
MAGRIIDILVGVYNDYRGHIGFGVWTKKRGRYYIEVDIRGVDLPTAYNIVRDLKSRLSQNGMWFRQLGPLKCVVKKSGDKIWRFCARVRDFSEAR